MTSGNFRKLKNSFLPVNYDILSSRIKFGEIIDNEFRGIEYFDISVDSENLLKIIPEQYQKDFCITLMKINTEVPPHTDTGINVTINFYYETSDCITSFYDFKTDPRKRQIQNQTDGYIFNEEDLIKTSSFQAKNYEAWVLDVTKPHSVKGNGNRVAISLATNTYTYEQVCQMMTETGAL